MRWTSESVNWVKDCSPVWMGLIQSVEGLNRTRGGVREKLLSLPDRGAGTLVLSLPRSGTCHRLSWISSLWIQTGIYTTGSPACRQQIMGLLSLHNQRNQFHIYNLLVGLFLWRTLTNTVVQGLNNDPHDAIKELTPPSLAWVSHCQDCRMAAKHWSIMTTF